MTLTERIAALQRVQESLAAVRDAMASLPAEERAGVLAALAAELGAETPREETPPGKPSPLPEPPAATFRRRTAKEAARCEIARELHAAGPHGLPSREIVDRTRLNRSVAYLALRHPWFRQTDPSYNRSPWVLTDAGRAAEVEWSPTPDRET